MPLAVAAAKARGMPSLPITCLKRDLDYLPEDEVKAVAEAAFDEIVGKLTRRAPEPARSIGA
ncbi:MAG: hypothetical protein HYX92_06775 [Chloroflexi bacterium]|nr:hypothetical protein [Chloroflexota bacterium]